MQIFCLFWFCILYRADTSVLLSFSLVYLVAFLLFAIKYAFACLPYFLRWFYALFDCFFVSKLLTFTFLLFCRLLPVPLPRFEWLLVNAFSFLLFSQIVYCLYSAACFLFCLVTAFLDVCLARFVLAFFALQISGAKQICACSFSFFLTLSFVFFAPPCVYWSISHHAPLPSPLFLPMVPSSPPWQPLPTYWIFPLCADIQKHVLNDCLRLFLPCFCLPPCLCIHSHSSAPICTHLYPSLTLFAKPPKTWCPGKFPRP